MCIFIFSLISLHMSLSLVDTGTYAHLHNSAKCNGFKDSVHHSVRNHFSLEDGSLQNVTDFIEKELAQG